MKRRGDGNMRIGIVMAMQEEADVFIHGLRMLKDKGSSKTYRIMIIRDGLSVGITLIVSGVGRTNGAVATHKLLLEGQDFIFNVGTCGAHGYKVGEVLTPDLFYDYDFGIDKYGHDPNKVNWKYDSIIDFSFCDFIRLFTVSYFCEKKLSKSKYLVDMEAYSIVAMCQSHPNTEVIVIKAVSDNGSEKDFELNLTDVMNKAYEVFVQKLTEVVRANGYRDWTLRN